ncbi:hypothetical protein K0M31_005668 [Melipona bicolor]|uniref:Uncharacterized protein n=1 Tax=Melipona bicolor TaxID=60889 RepID=A0AA40KM00_9HYME|nr:hypothetical protein K0M31_005668 [Melipona bicolor]
MGAYIRPKSTAVQIARIAAVTLVTMSVVLGSFILAGSWVQARASCTPESIAAMQAELRLQQQQQQQPSSITYQQGEFLKHLQPEALVQKISRLINQFSTILSSRVQPFRFMVESKEGKRRENGDNRINAGTKESICFTWPEELRNTNA